MIRLLLLVLLIAGIPVRADFSRGAAYNPSVDPDLYQQRQDYLGAMQMIRSSQFSKLQKEKPGLRTYPLYPYLIYTEMAYRISRQTETDIQAFATQYQDTPLVEPLTQHWLSSLAKRGKWDQFVKHYDKVSPTKALACQHAYGLHKVGRSEEAMANAAALWTVGFSQPEECDPVFNVWRGQNGMTPEIAWRRFSLALGNNERKLAGYLIRFISKDDKPFAENFRLVHQRPKTIKRYSAFRVEDPRNHEIILHGVKRLARTDPEDAFVTLQQYQSMHLFEPTQLEEAWASIGLRLARNSEDLALIETLPLDLHRHPKLIEERIRQALRLEDWSNVIVLINLLPQASQESARWQYWKARVLAQSEAAADRESAREIFEVLSQERTFYGFLSADILQSNYSYRDESNPVTLDQILSLEASPGIRRALELFALGERSRARREWYFSTADFNVREREVAARVALRWGWYKASIQTMIDAKAWNHLDFRFPLAYQDVFLAHARRTNIPVPWSMAIARQESAFMPDARSSAGAMGLMQLMPTTAQMVARRLGVSYRNNSSLTEPDLNIKLGTNYLGLMLRRFDNNRILASAAYNAGPGRVEQWLGERDPGSMPFDVWIELIPFTETRGYVQNVLMFSSIYARRLQENQPLLYDHERDYFMPRQISGLDTTAVAPEKS